MTISYSTPPKQVSVSAIRDELRALWAAEAMNDEAVIRARSHNLIVVIADDIAPQETIQTVIASAGERPGRVIVVDIDTNPDKTLDAWTSAFCRKSGAHQICGEIIAITVGYRHLSQATSLAISLLAPDLPVYLWWMGAPDVGHPLFHGLSGVANRLIVNLDSFADIESGIHLLARLAKTYRAGDLAWGRLTIWRQLLAQLWDAPESRGAMDHIRAVDIHYAAVGGEQRPARALLLAGWLASKLRWKIRSVSRSETGEYLAHFSQGKWQGKLEVSKALGSEAPSGEVSQVFVQAGASPPFVMPRLSLQPDSQGVETRWNIGSIENRHTVTSFAAMKDARALVEEFDMGYDPDYVDALNGATAILKAVKPS